MLWLPVGLIIWGLLFRTTELAGKKKGKKVKREELERNIENIYLFSQKAVLVTRLQLWTL